MDFGSALRMLKGGKRVTRPGMSENGEFLFLVSGSQFVVTREPYLSIFPQGTLLNYNAHIDIRTAEGKIMPWNGDHNDILAEDWELANEAAV